MSIESEIEDVRGRCQLIALECGLDVRCAQAGMDVDNSFRIIIEHTTMDLNFDVLEKLSRALGSRDINLGCDCGTSSDRYHDPYIIVRWPRLDSAILLVRTLAHREGT
jgi:hypothetical protein